MKRILTGITIGIAFGTIISIIFSLLFASGQYNPVNPYSFMGDIYYNNFTNIQIMIFAVSVWSAIGVTFSLSSLIFTNLTFSRLVTTILHFIISWLVPTKSIIYSNFCYCFYCYLLHYLEYS